MPTYQPGDYITTKCRRCNDVTGHVIMLVLNNEIAKVECKACGSVHKHWGTASDTKKTSTSQSLKLVKAGQSREQARELGRSTPSLKSSMTIKVDKTSRTRSGQDKNKNAWQESMVRFSALSPIIYSMDNSYTLDDYIQHPVFGRGVVISLTKPDKISVLFEEGVKILRCKI